jgi:hypothetical protein
MVFKMRNLFCNGILRNYFAAERGKEKEEEVIQETEAIEGSENVGRW